MPRPRLPASSEIYRGMPSKLPAAYRAIAQAHLKQERSRMIREYEAPRPAETKPEWQLGANPLATQWGRLGDVVFPEPPEPIEQAHASNPPEAREQDVTASLPMREDPRSKLRPQQA